jgi:hypothetical protein
MNGFNINPAQLDQEINNLSNGIFMAQQDLLRAIGNPMVEQNIQRQLQNMQQRYRELVAMRQNTGQFAGNGLGFNQGGFNQLRQPVATTPMFPNTPINGFGNPTVNTGFNSLPGTGGEIPVRNTRYDNPALDTAYTTPVVEQQTYVKPEPIKVPGVQSEYTPIVPLSYGYKIDVYNNNGGLSYDVVPPKNTTVFDLKPYDKSSVSIIDTEFSVTSDSGMFISHPGEKTEPVSESLSFKDCIVGMVNNASEENMFKDAWLTLHVNVMLKYSKSIDMKVSSFVVDFIELTTDVLEESTLDERESILECIIATEELYNCFKAEDTKLTLTIPTLVIGNKFNYLEDLPKTQPGQLSKTSHVELAKLVEKFFTTTNANKLNFGLIKTQHITGITKLYYIVKNLRDNYIIIPA